MLKKQKQKEQIRVFVRHSLSSAEQKPNIGKDQKAKLLCTWTEIRKTDLVSVITTMCILLHTEISRHNNTRSFGQLHCNIFEPVILGGSSLASVPVHRTLERTPKKKKAHYLTEAQAARLTWNPVAFQDKPVKCPMVEKAPNHSQS